MPSKSKKQAKIMAAACHNKEFAKKVGIDQDVACDFFKADQKRKNEELEMNVKRIRKMFSQIEDNKLSYAKETFDTIMSAKVIDALEAKRVVIGQQMFKKESVENNEEVTG